MTSSGAPHRVLPDGSLDILLRRKSASEPFRAVLVGTMTRALVVEEAAGAQAIGVRFTPGEAFRFLALPMAHVTDAVIPLDAVWGTLVSELEDRVSEARDIRARVLALAAVLERRQQQAAPMDLRVRKAVAALKQPSGPCPEPKLSSRQLRRLFETYVGVSPKVLERVLRMQRTVAAIERGPVFSWALLAQECGYCDQSHLVREFQALVGLSPTTFARARAMSVSSNQREPARVRNEA